MEEPRARLAEAVIERRNELGLSRQRLATKAEIAGQRLSVSTIANIERAHSDRYARESLDALDAALDWPTGTSQGVLDGRKEEPVDRPLAAHLDQLEAAHLDKLISVAVPVSKLTDAEALMVVLRCLSPEQFAMVARAVQADDRFAVS